MFQCFEIHRGDFQKISFLANEIINGGLTEWSNWSECSSACGRRTLRSRERYCSNPVPSNGGADCEGERFQLDMCEMLPCSSDLALSPVERHGEEIHFCILFHPLTPVTMTQT